MTSPANKQPSADRPDRDASKPAWRDALRQTIAAQVRELFAPLRKWLARHRVKVRRLGGLGVLVVGAGLMAGGLGPIGLSLIFVGTAALLLELDQDQRGPADRQRK